MPGCRPEGKDYHNHRIILGTHTYACFRKRREEREEGMEREGREREVERECVCVRESV